METKYTLGDLVYMASHGAVGRDVVKAIKVTGTAKRHSIEYGFAITGSSLLSLMLYRDDYIWEPESDIFADEDAAIRRHEILKGEFEKKQAEDERKRKQERIISAREALARAEADLEEPEDDE